MKNAKNSLMKLSIREIQNFFSLNQGTEAKINDQRLCVSLCIKKDF